MKLALLALLMTMTTIAQAKSTAAPADLFAGRKGCFLLYNMRTGKFLAEVGGKECRERYPACSTFKVPLAVMAFDSGVLKDERVLLKWDGVKEAREEANRDHDARSWMRESIVWFSQRLTPHLGLKRFRKYVKGFRYGNENLSGGIKEAWLLSPNDPKKALSISAHEQLEFMKKLWTDKLPASSQAMKITRDITYIETSPNGYALHGKTGSGFYDPDRKQALGWFIAHLQKGDEEYLVVTNFSDLKPSEEPGYGGLKARTLTKKILGERGLW
jgi:beta-lactamase class D